MIWKDWFLLSFLLYNKVKLRLLTFPDSVLQSYSSWLGVV